MKSKIHMFYDLLVENPDITNLEAAEILDCTNKYVSSMRERLEQQGYIQRMGPKKVAIIKPYTAMEESATSGYKASIYLEMIEAYMCDFRSQQTFNDRLAVGREIRLLLEKL